MAARPVPAGTSSSRRLVAVWFADIVGYSSLSSRDESAALQQIHNFQAACRDAVSAQGGRVVKYLGDGAFAEFPSTEAAVRSAQSLCELFSADGGLLRVGVHVGDVVVRTDGDLFGDGVNTASRLQVEARPGQILVSGDVWRQLRSVRGLEFQRIGRKELRGIEHAIELFAVRGEEGEREGGGGLAGFIRELRRRYVFRAGLVYLIAAWLVIQVAVAVWDPLGLPEWTATLVIVLAALGFPIALVLAWAFEIAPDGIVRTGRPHAAAGVSGRRLESSDTGPVASGVEAADEASTARPLPERMGPFVGREDEVGEIMTLFDQPGCRLVTITGPGGIGKTRLAVEIGHRNASRFADGAVFVPLAAHESPAAVMPAVADHLGIRLAPGADPQVQITDFLREKEILVVLDNFEQLVDHSSVVGNVLGGAPRVRLLVTSRERLNLRAESVYPLGGLRLQGEGEARDADAVELFVEASRRLNPDFVVHPAERPCVAELCAYLQGIPLAIELAAAWTRALTCKQILQKVRGNLDFLATDLHDVPERHRSVTAVFESAWQMLTEEERTALRRLSVFRGGFDVDAAFEVVGVTLDPLLSLLDQSLIRKESSGGFQLLEVLRQCAAAKLEADPLELRWMGERHSAFYLHAAAELGESQQVASSVEQLGRAYDNIRLAWLWAVQENRYGDLDASLEPLFDYLNTTGRLEEGAELFNAAIEKLEGGIEPGSGGDAARIVCRLRIRTGKFCAALGRYRNATALAQKGLAESRTLGLPAEEAEAYLALGSIAQFGGAFETARTHFESARDRFTELGDSIGRGSALVGLGNVAYATGRYDVAEEMYEESFRLLQGSGHSVSLVSAICNLGILAWSKGDTERSRAMLNRSLDLAVETKDQQGVATALLNLGVINFLAEDFSAAEQALHRGAALCRNLGFRRHLPAFHNIIGKVSQAQGKAAAAMDHCRQALVLAKEIDDIPAVLEALLSCASVLQTVAPAEAARTARYVHDHPSADHECRRSALALCESTSIGGGSEEERTDMIALDQIVTIVLAALDRVEQPPSPAVLQMEEIQ